MRKDNQLMTREQYHQNILDMIYLSACALHREIPEQSRLIRMDRKSLYAISKFHSMTAVTAMGLEAAGMLTSDGQMPENLVQAWKEAMAKSIRKNLMLDAERQKLCAFMDKHGIWYLIMQTLANTGIRVSELSYLQANNITDGHITVYNKGKSREIFIPDLLVRQLEQYCIDSGINSGAIFRGNTEKAISRCAIWQMLQRIADMLGITKEKAHPHSFRHFFGKRYITKFGDLSELADILGHSSIEITRIYTRSTVEEKRMKMNELLND